MMTGKCANELEESAKALNFVQSLINALHKLEVKLFALQWRNYLHIIFGTNLHNFYLFFAFPENLFICCWLGNKTLKIYCFFSSAKPKLTQMQQQQNIRELLLFVSISFSFLCYEKIMQISMFWEK
jgi:hypothetical protein